MRKNEENLWNKLYLIINNDWHVKKETCKMRRSQVHIKWVHVIVTMELDDKNIKGLWVVDLGPQSRE